ncbi:MAG TPA: cell division protein [Archaeoglobus profundus]|nr:cell division protein [Archaeoglobus profundus]
MRLLTIGIGKNGAEVSSLLAKKGGKVNNIQLFKCYAIVHNIEHLKSIKLSDKNKFYLMANERVDTTGVLNEILSRYEIYEGSLLITSIDVEENVLTTVEIGKNLATYLDDPIIGLIIIPPLNDINVDEFKRRVNMLKKVIDVLMFIERSKITSNYLVEAMNILGRIGEIDLKRKMIGEVVVDTSDIFNTLLGEGFSIFGFAKRKILPWWIRIMLERSELKAVRTRRMIELVKDAMRNLSVQADIKSASKALVIFSGNPNEITMDGLLSSIGIIESLNDKIEVRYGDYSIPKSQHLYSVLLFSGLTKLIS